MPPLRQTPSISFCECLLLLLLLPPPPLLLLLLLLLDLGWLLAAATLCESAGLE
jgi:hypothetical protein